MALVNANIGININIERARGTWKEFQTYVSDFGDGVEYRLKDLREQLARAGASAAALDPAGKKSDADMEAEIALATNDAYVRYARQVLLGLQTKATDTPGLMLGIYAQGIRDALAKAGRGLEALDPEGRKTAPEMEEALADAGRKYHLNSARREFQSFEKDDHPHDRHSCDYNCQKLRKWAEQSGNGLEAICAPGDFPPSLQGDVSPDVLRAHIEERLAAASRKGLLLSARGRLKDLEDEKLRPSGDSAEYIRTTMFEELELAGAGKTALDPSGQSSAAELDRRIEEAVRKCHFITAQKETKEFIDRFDKCDRDSRAYYRGAVLKHLKLAGADLAALGLTGIYAADIVEARFDELEDYARLKNARDELEAFERMSPPFEFAAIRATASRVASHFNRVARQLAAEHPDDPDIRAKIDARIGKAAERARERYFEANGKIPVMKALSFRTPAGRA